MYQQIDLRLCKLLAKPGHAGFPARHYRSHRSDTGHGRILFPPFRIGEIRRLKKVTLRRVAPPIGSVTAGAILIEQLVNLPHTGGSPPLQRALNEPSRY
jgi:hypothetical protein